MPVCGSATPLIVNISGVGYAYTYHGGTCCETESAWIKESLKSYAPGHFPSFMLKYTTGKWWTGKIVTFFKCTHCGSMKLFFFPKHLQFFIGRSWQRLQTNRTSDPLDYTYPTLEKVTLALTFVEALLTVHDGNPVSSETGGPVELTMVLVQLPIWTAHGFIVWLTVIQALTLPLASLMVDYTVMPQTAVLVLTWTRKAIMSH